MHTNRQIKLLFQKKIATLLIVIAIFLIVFFISQHIIRRPEPISTPSVLVQVEKIQLKSTTKSLVTYGTITAVPEQIHQFTAKNEVSVQQIFVVQGQHVKTNDPLIRISLSTASNLNLENAKINVDFNKKELSRLLNLQTQYLATNAEVQIAKQNLAKAEVELLTFSNSQTEGEILKAPHNGIVISINIQLGQVVAAGTSLITFADSSQVQIRLGVESEDLAVIKIGQKVIVSPIYDKLMRLTGHVEQVTGQIDPTTGLVSVVVYLENVSKLILGNMVRGEILLAPEEKMLVVPRNAVLYEKAKPYVFVNIHGKAQQRFVTTGNDDGIFIAITKGLRVNEQVVTVGNYELTNGMALRLDKP